jgi:hypothetical protein
MHLEEKGGGDEGMGGEGEESKKERERGIVRLSIFRSH